MRHAHLYTPFPSFPHTPATPLPLAVAQEVQCNALLQGSVAWPKGETKDEQTKQFQATNKLVASAVVVVVVVAVAATHRHRLLPRRRRVIDVHLVALPLSRKMHKFNKQSSPEVSPTPLFLQPYPLGHVNKAQSVLHVLHVARLEMCLLWLLSAQPDQSPCKRQRASIKDVALLPPPPRLQLR